MNKQTMTGFAAATCLAGLVAFLLWEDLFLSSLGNYIQGNAYWLIFSVPLAVTTAAAAWFARQRTTHPSYWPVTHRPGATELANRKAAQRRFTLALMTAVVALLATIAGVVYTNITHDYQLRKALVASVKVTDATAPEFRERAAYQVAHEQAKGNLAGLFGEVDDVTYAADRDEFTTLVSRPGNWMGVSAGYSGLSIQKVRFTGQAEARSCPIDAQRATDRLGGKFSHSLEREIAHVRRGYTITDSDAYGVCVTRDGKQTPLVVVPLKDHRGWFPAVEVPAGVAVYNGLDGSLEIFDDVKAGQLPGPVFPTSLAVDLREATAAMGSLADFRNGRVGYQDTSADTTDPNAGNRSEFALATTGGTGVYVTPLTQAGRGTAISAVGVVESSSVTAGKFNAYTVYKLAKERQSNSAVVDKIKTDYGDLPEWGTQIKVFEITPVTTTEWVASLGHKLNVAYRLRVRADGSSSCLERADGTIVRCGRATDTGGNGPGVSLAPGTGTAMPLPNSEDAIRKLSDQEFTNLMNRVTTEAARRLAAK